MKVSIPLDNVEPGTGLANRAVATSTGQAARFDARGDSHHLFDPARGDSANHHRMVTVIADHAITADALSTALFVAPFEAGRNILKEGGGRRAYIVTATGERHLIDADPLER